MAKIPLDGGLNIVIPAIAPQVRNEPEKYRGVYLVPDGKIGVLSKTAEDEQLAKDLWTTTEKVLEDAGLS